MPCTFKPTLLKVSLKSWHLSLEKYGGIIASADSLPAAGASFPRLLNNPSNILIVCIYLSYYVYTILL